MTQIKPKPACIYTNIPILFEVNFKPRAGEELIIVELHGLTRGENAAVKSSN